MTPYILLTAAAIYIALGFIFKHGPCRVCGRKWMFGSTVNNVAEVCSWRCRTFDHSLHHGQGG